MAESIPWNRFLGSLNVYKYGLRYNKEKKSWSYLGDSHELLDKALVLYVPEVHPLVGNVQQGEPVRLQQEHKLNFLNSSTFSYT